MTCNFRYAGPGFLTTVAAGNYIVITRSLLLKTSKKARIMTCNFRYAGHDMLEAEPATYGTQAPDF